jgi:membrane protease YdiL (CAAX protease family)
VILEAAIYALTLGALITIVLDRLLGLGVDGSSVVAALGAGVHEELVFRLGLFAGFVALLSGLERRFAVGLALVTSSLLFAAAHHLGVHGEPFTLHAFAFRTLAGAAFGAIFWFRSFAHAVYAHVLYDIVVAAS